MKLHRFTLTGGRFAAAVGLLFAFVTCGPGGEDVEELNQRMTRMMGVTNQMTSRISSVRNEDEAAAAIDWYSDETVLFVRDIRALHKKYPGLTKKFRTPSAEVKRVRAEYADALQAEQLAMKTMLEKYGRSPVVMGARKRETDKLKWDKTQAELDQKKKLDVTPSEITRK